MTQGDDEERDGTRATRALLHDINNQLTLIIYSVELAGSRLDDGSEAHADLERIASAARSIAALVEELRSGGSEHVSPPAAPAAPPEHGECTVLIVDDSATMRQLIAGTLEEAGFPAIAAADAAGALKELREQPAIDVLLADVQMPEVSGPELAAQARQLRPDLPILFLTGDAAGAIEFEGGSAPALGKPFVVSELLDALRLAREG